jgi:hypothetical protein
MHSGICKNRISKVVTPLQVTGSNPVHRSFEQTRVALGWLPFPHLGYNQKELWLTTGILYTGGEITQTVSRA